MLGLIPLLSTSLMCFLCRIRLLKFIFVKSELSPYYTASVVQANHYGIMDGFKKKKLKEFSIKLAGWVLDARFSIKKKN